MKTGYGPTGLAMAEEFDPYQTWLGIPPDEQPPNHYRLLGLKPFESDQGLIQAAADQRVGNLHAAEKGEHAKWSLKLLNEVAVAKICLLNLNRKAAYDAGLREILQAALETVPSPPPPTPMPRAKRLGDDPKPAPRKEEPEDLGFVPIEEDMRSARRATPSSTSQPVAKNTGAKWADTLPEPPGRDDSPPDEEFPSVAGDASPLDGLMDDLSSAAGGSPLTPVAPRKKGLRKLFALRTHKRIGWRTSVWDSPLIRFGGGTLLAFLIVTVVLTWAMTRETGDGAFRLAEEAYRRENYAQAVFKYERYLQRFPNHDFTTASLARVKRGLAQLREVTPRGTRDWSAALQKAKDVVAEIETEPEFGSAGGDLSVILLSIAEGLAEQAREEPNRETVEQSWQALTMLQTLGEFVSLTESHRAKISQIDALLGQIAGDLAVRMELRAAIGAMREALAQGNPNRAYEIRTSLLGRFTSLANHGDIEAARHEVSLAQQVAVEWVQRKRPAETSEPYGQVLPEMALARCTTTGKVPDASGKVVFTEAAGAVYGLDALSGKVLWRRFVGFGSDLRSLAAEPTLIASANGEDVLVVDPVRNELVRLEASGGKLIWRQALKDRFDSRPVVAGEQILVATRKGRLVRVDAATGNSPGYLKIPQKLSVAPAVDVDRSLIFQVADLSDLFVLGLEGGPCRQVVYLGHAAGTITAPPLIVDRLLIVAVNDRVKSCTLRVLAIEASEEAFFLTPVQEIDLEEKGHVHTTPLTDGRRVLVITDLGVVSVFEVGSGPGLTETSLTKRDVRAAGGRLALRLRIHEDDALGQPLRVIGQTVFHVRHQEGLPGVLVAATDADQSTPYWETRLAVPLAGEPIIDRAAGKITAVTSLGAVYRLETSVMQEQGVEDTPRAAPFATRPGRPVTDVVLLESGQLAVSTGPGSDQITLVDPDQGQARRLTLPEPLACSPRAFSDGLLVPSRTGAVFLINPRPGHGRNLKEPFRPVLKNDVDFAWRASALVGDGSVLLADGSGNLYRLGVMDRPPPRLVALNRAELACPVVSPMAVLGNVACAVDQSGVLAKFTLPELARKEVQSLAGRCVWGPQTVDDCIMLATDAPELLCLDGGGELRWQQPLPYGPLAGLPLATAGAYVLASRSGVLWRVDAATGEELGVLETGRPLATGPVPLGGRLLLGGHDGTLCLVQHP